MELFKSTFCTLFVISLLVSTSFGARLTEVQVVDQNYLLVKFLDGEVTHQDNGLGSKAFLNSGHESNSDTVKLFNPALNTTAAQLASNWTLKSTDDVTFGEAGLHPSQCFRKTKMNGHAEQAWVNNDYQYVYTYEHTIFLKLPQAMQQGMHYSLDITGTINSDKTASSFVFDIFQSRSEAVHINLVGYHPDPSIKSADLYIWMGDGSARDYTTFEGKTVYLYDVNSKQNTVVGQVSSWKASGSDVGGYNLTRSKVWNADFSSFSTPGTYRLAIEGVGCSQDFVIADDVYHDPFMVSVQGFFYMRIGQDSVGGIRPVPRRPLYIPDVSPANTKVYLTTMQPYHSEWATFSSGDVWDRPDDWARFRKAGNPTNPNARGGHSDALDWDRYLGHVANIYDMLLPFYLTGGAIKDDNLDIAESGNGIPDILDEARNEVDFWLRLRDGAAYSHGLTNPNTSNEFFQAGPTAVAAWANAANAAMLADCFRIAGLTSQMNEYCDSAVVAYKFASGLTDQMLDKTQGIGDAVISGGDLKTMAAAFLYNITGETTYEDAVNLGSVVTNTTSLFDDYNNGNSRNQVWATAGYLFTPRTVHYPVLFANMKASIIYQAKQMEANYINTRPSRRSTSNVAGYFKTAQNVQQTLIAHAITDVSSDKTFFRKALVLEADYGLGRNPMNMIQMTTASTPLENKRSVTDAYTTGGNDGTPGMHPGHTPYFNLDDWNCGMTMGCPSKLYANAYPANFKTTWPADEGYFPTRYVWAHVEFTPQQTMRGKAALYGYLYGLSKMGSSSVSWYFNQKPVKGSSSHSIDRGETVRVVDMAGRVIWTGLAGTNPEAIFRKIPSRGVYFLERVQRGNKAIRFAVVKN
jgi:endoglucanase